MNWKEYLKEILIDSIGFSGSIAFAVFLCYLIFSRDLFTSLYLGGCIWLVFWFVIFCSEILSGNPFD